MASAYTLILCNRNGTPIKELKEVSLDRVAWNLDPTEDEIVFSLAADAPGAADIALEKTEVQLWIDDDLHQWCVLREVSGDFSKMTFKAEGLMTYFQYRFVIEADRVYEDIEQMTIAADLITYAQSAAQGTNPDLNIDIGAYSGSGILRTREYISDRKHNIFDAVNEFPTLDDGFEMSIELFGDGRREWKPWYPQRGTDKTDIVLEAGRNVVNASYKETSQKMATKIDATGGTTQDDPFNPLAGRQKQYYLHEDTAASTEFGVHIAVLPSGARSDIAWLQSRAEGAARARKAPIKTAGLTCRQGDVYPQLIGVVEPGDLITTAIDRGRLQLSGTQRVKTVEWLPTSDHVLITPTSVVEGT